MIPGLPDYSYFVSQVVQMSHSVGLMGWFWGISWALLLLAFVFSMAQLLMGNRLGFQLGVVRVMVALALLTILSRPEGAAARAELLKLWSNAHQFVAGRTVRPIANNFSNWMLNIRDATKGALEGLGLMALGGTAVGVAGKMGVKGAKAVLDYATELRGKMGSATKGVGVTGAFQRTATVGRYMGWGVMFLVVPYIAAMVLSGLMAYFGIALMPLGVGLLAIGNNRLLAATFSLYFSGIVLGVVAPMVFAASVKTAGQITYSQVYRQLQEAQALAEQAANEFATRSQEMRFAAEQYAAEMTKDDPNKPKWQKYIDALGDKLAQAKQWVSDRVKFVTQPIDALAGRIAGFLVTSVISLFVWVISFGSLLYASVRVMNAFAGIRL